MKRPRSYGEDLDAGGGGGGGGAGRDWGRLHSDIDRVSHRRFVYTRPGENGGRKGATFYDRGLEDERDAAAAARGSRKQHRGEYEFSDGLERRRGGFDDQYHHRRGESGGGEPRAGGYGYGGERMHRSESFSSSSSAFRRDFPKGFRSDRDRIRREDVRRRPAGAGNRDSDGDCMFGSDRATRRGSSDSKSPAAASSAPSPGKEAAVKSTQIRKEPGNNGRSKIVEVAKVEDKVKIVNSSEMEEGELEPEPELEQEQLPEKLINDLEPTIAGEVVKVNDLEATVAGEVVEQLERNPVVEDLEPPVTGDEKLDSERDATIEEIQNLDKTNEADEDDGIEGDSGEEMSISEKNASSSVMNDKKIYDLVGNETANEKDEQTPNDEMVVASLSKKTEHENREEQMPNDEMVVASSSENTENENREELKPNDEMVLAGMSEEGENEKTEEGMPNNKLAVTCVSNETGKEKNEERLPNDELAVACVSKESDNEKREERMPNDELVVACVSKDTEDDKRREQMPVSVEKVIVEKTDVQMTSSLGADTMEKLPSSSSNLKHLEGHRFDLEMEVGDFVKHGSQMVLDEYNSGRKSSLNLMNGKLNQGNSDNKGKNLAISLIDEDYSGNCVWNMSKERDDTMEGPSSRGLDLFFHSDLANKKVSSTYHDSKSRSNKSQMEPLDLSLGLANFVATLPSSGNDLEQTPDSPSRGRSHHSLATTSYTQSDGFNASVSISGSHTVVHNPSCSLTQNSYDYENSVGSHPIFQSAQDASPGIWHGHSSNDPKKKDIPLFQKILQNGNGAVSLAQMSKDVLRGHSECTGIPLVDRQGSLHKQLSNHLKQEETRSPTHSIGSFDARPEHSRDKKWVKKERNGGGVLLRTSLVETDKVSINSPEMAEILVTKMVREPTHLMARTIQDIPDHYLSQLKVTAGEMLSNDATLRSLKKLLDGRSDLNLETLSNCIRFQLELLVAVKTGLTDFLFKAANVASADLVEIFLNLKCRNLACQSILPVDDCDCKVCGEKNGFCRDCMCIICRKFDNAADTCSWVGCDVCIHWCHTDCALRGSHIRNGVNAASSHGTTEMQFFCLCGHPSEMFGFVKEVFRTCAKDWKVETFSKELEYVRRIFRASEDVRGRQLYDVASRMMERLVHKSNLSEVYNCVMTFLAESEYQMCKTQISPVETSLTNLGAITPAAIGPSQESLWLRPAPIEPASRHIEKTNGVPTIVDWEKLSRHVETPKLPTNSETPFFDELESIVRMKQAEAQMFQTRADDARREVECLKRIATAKNKEIEENYQSQVRKLNLAEAEEIRRQKVEQVKFLERAHHECSNMKARMDADIKDLMLKMEATKRNLSSGQPNK